MAGNFTEIGPSFTETPVIPAGKIKFAVININHPHIYGMTEAIKRGGGELVALYAKEADLTAAFIKAYPEARLAKMKTKYWKTPPFIWF